MKKSYSVSVILNLKGGMKQICSFWIQADCKASALGIGLKRAAKIPREGEVLSYGTYEVKEITPLELLALCAE